MEDTGPETFMELSLENDDNHVTSPGPNLEQKVPSAVPDLQATESLAPPVSFILIKWRSSSLSDVNSIIFYLELTYLDSEAFK